jgi:hypothetical protein
MKFLIVIKRKILSSQSVQWKAVLIELRNNLRSDEKSKSKRFILNRLIDECSTVGFCFKMIKKNLYYMNFLEYQDFQ